MSEGYDGMFTFRCKDKTTAVKAMKEAWDEFREHHEEKYGKQEITEDKLIEDVLYEHRRCESYNVGDNVCCFCGETCGTNGRRTFTIAF